MNVIDRTRTALARMISPAPARRQFEGAHGRPWHGTPAFGRTATETLNAVAPLRQRARHLYGNNPHARAAVEAWVTALVGTGARANPSHPDADARAAVSAAIDRWSDFADIDGVTDWYGLQANIARAMVIDGEALIMPVETPEGLRLRHLPAEQLDESETRDLGGGAQIVGGVEFDSFGRRVAYWIRPEAPTAFAIAWQPARRVAAHDVIHLFRSLGAGQVRGVSWLAPVITKLRDLDELNDALLVGFKTSACFAGFLEDGNAVGGDNPFAGVQHGSLLVDGLEPGTVKVLPAGFKLTFASPQQAQQAPEFLSAELRAVAVGIGVPAHLVSGDLSKANYSSLRADLVSFRQRYEQIQYGTIAPQLLRRVHARAVTSLILTGNLLADGFEGDPTTWTSAEFLFPAAPWVDPQKDAAAYRELIDAGLTSRRQVVAERGWSIEALDAEIAADRARESALGLNFGAAPPTLPQQQQEEGQGDV
ncbi:phage portal protein [uncultured Brevundimonas sp.]|uniref:phage portal protein n=1 Tax=uncultured Brevundimonas sp. TaxID=213418 RepID=UPI0025DB08B7|nr:phage portal protein [uncultured Brevundimonas sp.]